MCTPSRSPLIKKHLGARPLKGRKYVRPQESLPNLQHITTNRGLKYLRPYVHATVDVNIYVPSN